MRAVLFREVCECARACAHAYVTVDTGRALTNRAENETSPLIKRSNIDLDAVLRYWIHT